MVCKFKSTSYFFLLNPKKVMLSTCGCIVNLAYSFDKINRLELEILAF